MQSESIPLLSAQAVTLSDATARCHPRQFVKDLQCTLYPGEAWCVLGPNGAGKSTLLRVLAGLQPPTAGVVRWQGQPLATQSPHYLAQQRAYCPQQSLDVFSATVEQAVGLARYPFLVQSWLTGGGLAAQDHQVIRDAMMAMDLQHLAGRDVQQLSGGERQRVALATALAQGTDCLLLDEPLAHLDLRHQRQVMDCLRGLNRQQHKTLLLVMHDINWAAYCATHVLLLHGDGRWQAGLATELLQPEPLQALFNTTVQCLEKNGQRWFVVG